MAIYLKITAAGVRRHRGGRSTAPFAVSHCEARRAAPGSTKITARNATVSRVKAFPGAYPALAGNRAVTMPQTTNLVQAVLHGGFAPATAGNPRPFGMPPYLLVLDDADIAAVLTHLRTSWGNAAACSL